MTPVLWGPYLHSAGGETFTRQSSGGESHLKYGVSVLLMNYDTKLWKFILPATREAASSPAAACLLEA